MSLSRSVVRNTWWNFLGWTLPILVALFAIPPLIRGLGAERFGILAVAWAVMGYFALFDLGLGKATTKFASEYAERRDPAGLSSLVWNSLYLHLLLGLVGGAIFAVIAPWLNHRVFNIPWSLQSESLGSLYWLAATIPAIVATSCLRGVLEAMHRFDLVNLVKIPASSINYLAPLAVSYFRDDLVSVVAVISITRVLVLLAYLWLCLTNLAELGSEFRVNLGLFWPLVSFGGWVTVSSLVAPMIIFADRFFIASIFSVEAITYYVTPYEIVTKLWIFSASLLGALFPLFSALSLSRASEIEALSKRAFHYLLMIVTPIVGILITFGRELLLLWVGPEFAVRSETVTKWLAVGVLINVLAQVPFTALQGVGRPDIVARVQLLQLPFYLIVAWYLVSTRGIVGAAMAWALRAAVDAGLLQLAARKVFPTNRSQPQVHDWLRKGGIVVLFLATSWAIDGIWRFSAMVKLPLFGVILGIFLVWEWRMLLSIQERDKLRKSVERIACVRP